MSTEAESTAHAPETSSPTGTEAPSALAPQAGSEPAVESPDAAQPPEQPSSEEPRARGRDWARVRKVEREVEAKQKAIQQREQELAERAQMLELLDQDPVGFLEQVAKKRGVPLQQQILELNQRLLRGDDDKQVDALKKEVEELKQHQRKQLEQEEQQRHRTVMERAQSEVLGVVRENAARWPLVAGFPPERVGPAALQIISDHFEKGKVLAYEEALEYLEGELKQFAQLLKRSSPQGEAPDRVGAVTGQQDPERVQDKGNAQASGPAESASSTTITNLHAAERASPAKPLSLDDWLELASKQLVIRQ